jgi:hypothetical protein
MRTEEVVSVELNYEELWTLIESLSSNNSILYGKLSAARVGFERQPKVYGKGHGIKVREVAE